MLDDGEYICLDAAQRVCGGISLDVRERTVAFATDQDDDRQALNGRHRYRLHFDHPRFGGRSLTVYVLTGDLARPSAARFRFSGHRGLRPNADGSIDLRIQCDPPSAPLAANWIRCPPGDFRLALRADWPHQTPPDGVWSPPVVRRLREDAIPQNPPSSAQGVFA